MKAVDCQGLAGGFTLGTAHAGFEVIAKLELPGAFGMANVQQNEKLINPGGIEYTEGDWQDWPVYDVPYVFGNPPCAGFSALNTAGAQAKKLGKPVPLNARGPDSPINDCMWAFAHYVSRVKPVIAAFESVQGAGRMGRGLMRELRAYVVEQTGIQYNLTHVFMNALMTGAAQNRKRYFWVLHQGPFGVSTPPRHPATVHDAIWDLQGLELTIDAQDPGPYRPSNWAKIVTGAGTRKITWHQTDNKPATRRIIALAETGLWAQETGHPAVAKAVYDRDGRLPHPWEDIDPHTKNWGFYETRRVSWTRYMHVLTGGGLDSFIHPTENRPLTMREASRFMGYPDAWDWGGAASINQAGVWIGKGLAVQAGRWLSEQVRSSLEGKAWEVDGLAEPDKKWGIEDHEYVINVDRVWKDWVS